jgi:drug/metabolite transporter (DMT)-like permease
MGIRSEKGLGMLRLLGGATLISFSAVFVKLAHVGPTVAGFYRMAIGGLILATVLFRRRSPFRRDRSQILPILACSFFFALDLTFWHRSIHYVGPGLATLLSNFQALFLAACGVLFFGERMTARFCMALFSAMAGLYLIVGWTWQGLNSGYKLGVLLGGLTALCYTAYILTLRRLQSRKGPASTLETVAFITLLTAFFLGLEGLATGESFSIPDVQSLAVLAGYGLLCQVLGWVLITGGLPTISASRVGLILLLQPVLSFLWDILFFARPTTLWDGLGAALALFGIYLGTTGKPSPAKIAAPTACAGTEG